MSAAVVEFLNENAGRAYPIIEDSQPTGLETNLVLDYRGATREGLTAVYLDAVVGPSVIGAPAEHQPDAGVVNFYIRVDGPQTRTIKLSAPVGSEIPFVTNAVVDDPDYPGFDLLSLTITIGAGLADLAADTYLYLQDSAPFEPGLTMRLANSVVDSLKVVRQTETDFFVGGDVVIRGGYGIDVRHSGAAIAIEPRVGGGELGRHEGIPGETLGCGDVLRHLSSVRPDDKGRLFIRGVDGIKVENYPDEHRIKIIASRVALPTEARC